MTKEEVKEIFDHNWTKLVNPDYSDEELGEAQNMAIASLEAWEAVEKEVDEIINRPYLNIMECVLALREIRDIIKKHLREVEE